VAGIEPQLSEKTNDLDVVVDISDPFGSSMDVYKRCALEIKAAIDKMIDKLVEGQN